MKVVFENRAWEKAEHPRLVSNKVPHPHKDGHKIVFCIGYHYIKKAYYVDVNDYHPRTIRGEEPCYGKMEYFGPSVETCFTWIKENYGYDAQMKTPTPSEEVIKCYECEDCGAWIPKGEERRMKDKDTILCAKCAKQHSAAYFL